MLKHDFNFDGGKCPEIKQWWNSIKQRISRVQIEQKIVARQMQSVKNAQML